MPLTPTGKRVLKNFKKTYGDSGEDVFYAWLNKKTPRQRRRYEKTK